jgi:AraC-like DNA-binding protein
LRQLFSLERGLKVHIADFQPRETTERRFESTWPLLRFYFHLAASGYWELHSPQGDPSALRIDHGDRISTMFFYPELAGKMHLPAARRQSHLSLAIQPSLLRSYLGEDFKQLPADLRAISEGCLDRGWAHYGPLSEAMQLAIQQLLTCPYTGALKRLYLEGKAIELLAHKLAQLATPELRTPALKLRTDDLDRIRYAREILGRDLESPPRLLDLAHAVGTNHATLNKGFREVFGATVFGCLRQMRLQEARRLLEDEGLNVTEAALTVGYSSIPSFSKAFTEFFGENPKNCLKKNPRLYPDLN